MRLARWGLVISLLVGIMVAPSARPAAAAGPCDIVSGTAEFQWAGYDVPVPFPGPTGIVVTLQARAKAEVADPRCKMALSGRVEAYPSDSALRHTSSCWPTQVGTSPLRCIGEVAVYTTTSASYGFEQYRFVARVDGLAPDGTLVHDTASCVVTETVRYCRLRV